MTQIIVKVQKPIVTTEETVMYLIYNKDRSVQTLVEPDKNLRQMMKKHFKRYFHAEYNPETSTISVGKPTTSQDW